MIWDDTELKAFFSGGYGTNINIKPFGRAGRPLYNEPVAAIVPGVYKSNLGTARELMKWSLKSPEALGILQAITNDMLHGYHFKAIDNSSGPGRKKDSAEKVAKAEDFSKRNMVSLEREQALFDCLITGDGYLWKGKPEKDKRMAEDILRKTLKNYNGNIEYKSNSFKFPSGREIKVSEFFDEDVQEKSLEHVASTTVEPIYTAEKVIGFKQLIGSAELVDSTGTRVLRLQTNPMGLAERFWTEDEIIHFKFLSVDGKVWGYSPTQALLPIISTLQLHKDYMGHFFDNNGIPNKIFIFKKASPQHPSVKALENVLEMGKKSANKNRNLILTSEVEVTDLNRFDKDMEFRQLVTYYTGLIALAFNMPMNRIQAIVVDKRDEGSDINDSAYWRSISKKQQYWADIENSQFWNPEFGVDIVFDNPFVQDKIREAQKQAQMWAVANSMLRMGASSDYVMDFLEIPERFRKDFKLQASESNSFQQSKSPDNESNPKLRNQKKKEQEKVQEDRGYDNEGF